MHDAGHNRSASFLVRFWWEPREDSGQEPVLRGYLRSLQTGEEIYLSEPAEVTELISRHLRLGETQAMESADDLRSAEMKATRPGDGSSD